MNGKKIRRIGGATLILAVLLVASLVFGGYYFKQYKDLKSSTSKTTDQLNKELISEVNKVYQLPTDEEPTIVVVSKDPKDFTTDQEKQFSTAFKDLKKDDDVLLYQKAAQAILYRPSEKRVISTAVLNVKQGVKVHLIAATDAQAKLEKDLLSTFSTSISINGKATPSGTYTATSVIDMTGKQAELAKQLAQSIGGTVQTSLPVAEKPSEGAEIVIIYAGTSAN